MYAAAYSFARLLTSRRGSTERRALRDIRRRLRLQEQAAEENHHLVRNWVLNYSDQARRYQVLGLLQVAALCRLIRDRIAAVSRDL